MSEKKITFWIDHYTTDDNDKLTDNYYGPLSNMRTENLELLAGDINDILCERANSVLKEDKNGSH